MDELEQEFRECAFMALRENPGIGYNRWVDILEEQYPLELVDALGVDPFTVYSTLDRWWSEEHYHDALTGLDMTYAEWANCFATSGGRALYGTFENSKSEHGNHVNFC